MPRTQHQILRLVGLSAFAIGVLTIAGVGQTWAENPPACTEPEVEIVIREFLDIGDDGTPDVLLAPGALKKPGDVILYQAIVKHLDAARCGYENGRLCIDTPQLGCADAAGGAYDPPSFTTVGAGECCEADLINPVPLVCNPAFCNPPGVAEHESDYVRYVVNPADEANPTLDDKCDPGQLRAHAYYDRGESQQNQIVIPANASIPICNAIRIDVKHFMCYELDKTLVNANVDLADRFGSQTALVKNMKRICNPADKNMEDPQAVDFPDHLVNYELESPPFSNIKVVVSNQFGQETIELQRATRLLVPTRKGDLGVPPLPPAGPPNPALIDHFRCYSAKGPNPNQTVLIDDQFNPTASYPVDVKRPRTVCVPVDKNNEGFINANGADGSGLVCYEVRADERQEYKGDFIVDNQFTGGPLLREVHGPRELCLQSTIVFPIP